jgi:hypothetical protein
MLSSAVTRPFGVENAFPVHPAVGVGAEVIALGLGQVGGQAGAAVGVVIGQGRAEGQGRDAAFSCQRHHFPQAAWRVFIASGKLGVDHQVGQDSGCAGRPGGYRSGSGPG